MMEGDEFESGRDEAAPIDMLAAFFEAHGWPFEHVSEEEIVATTQGSWAQYELRAIWREQDQVLQLLALPDIRVPEEKRPAIYETL
ncbi:MAG TPA: YbjN domain-containing protein, partial [Rhizorhapis sp.]|nr:YbjN domain-containing protein [Rhizorhapis sp.]